MAKQNVFRQRTRAVAREGPFLVAGKENMLYLSGTEAATYMLVPLDGDPILLVPRLEGDRVRAESWVADIREYQDGEVALRRGEKCIFLSSIDALTGILREMGTTTIRFDSLSEKTFAQLSCFGPARSNLLEEMRQVKSREEIEMIARARRLVGDAYLEVSSNLGGTPTELDLAGRIYSAIASRGANCAFEPIVAFGARSAFPHSTPSTRRLSASSPVLMDLGARVRGYCSDITRTMPRGRPRAERTLELVRSTLCHVVDHLEPGMPVSQADLLARKFVGKEAAFFTHRLGHGIGLAVHEAPSLSATSKEVLKDGTVFTVEPGLYYAGRYGVRWEEDVFCWNGRFRVLG